MLKTINTSYLSGILYFLILFLVICITNKRQTIDDKAKARSPDSKTKER